MRVLYHHRTRGEDVEGVHIRGLVGGLRELGHEVLVVSPRGEEAFTGLREGAAEPARHRAPAWSMMRWLARRMPEIAFEFAEICYNILAAIRLRRAISRFKPDVVYERYALFLMAGVVSSRSRGIPIVLEMNDSAVVERVRRLMLKGLASRFERWILERATGIVFVSTQFRSDCERHYRSLPPSIVSANCADTRVFDPELFDKAAIRRELGIPADACVAGYVGGFVHWHRVQWFVSGIAPSLKQHPKLVLLLVGDGVERAPVLEICGRFGLANQLVLPGKVRHEDVPRMIAAMDFAVLPDSNVFGSPMKLFEFMAMKVPVVAPDVPPIAEVVRNGETGWLFPRGDLAACIAQTLATAGLGAGLSATGSAARMEIVQRRQWKHNAEALIELASSREAAARIL